MVAFVFPGQGSQKVGMGQELAARYPGAWDVFMRADDALGFALTDLCFDGPAEQLTLTANAQPAILTVSVAILEAVKKDTSLEPSVVAGHSLGEFSALVCAGALSFEDAVRVVHRRGQFMQEAVPAGQGAMAAVRGISPEDLSSLCDAASDGKVVCPANFNSPRQTVLSGDREAVDRALALVAERGGSAMRLPVSAPFHCPLMEPAATRLAQELEAISFEAPSVPVVSNVEAAPNRDPGRIKDLLVRQVTAPVRWSDCVAAIKGMGVSRFFELGPGKALAGLIRQSDASLEVTNFELPEQIEALEWDREGDRKVHRSSGKIVWDDGIEWDPEAPGAYGF